MSGDPRLQRRTPKTAEPERSWRSDAKSLHSNGAWARRSFQLRSTQVSCGQGRACPKDVQNNRIPNDIGTLHTFCFCSLYLLDGQLLRARLSGEFWGVGRLAHHSWMPIADTSRRSVLDRKRLTSGGVKLLSTSWAAWLAQSSTAPDTEHTARERLTLFARTCRISSRRPHGGLRHAVVTTSGSLFRRRFQMTC